MKQNRIKNQSSEVFKREQISKTVLKQSQPIRHSTNEFRSKIRNRPNSVTQPFSTAKQPNNHQETKTTNTSNCRNE